MIAHRPFGVTLRSAFSNTIKCATAKLGLDQRAGLSPIHCTSARDLWDTDHPEHCAGSTRWAWPGNKSSLQHLRLALEGGCESCTRDTHQGDTFARDPHDETAIGFSTCCL